MTRLMVMAATMMATMVLGCAYITAPLDRDGGDGDIDADVDADGDSDGDSDGDVDADGDTDNDADEDVAADGDLDSDEEALCLFYQDQDGDGYGNPDESRELPCGEQEGYVEDNEDCDDEDDLVHPGMPELCDDLDNDCNEEIDEGIGFCFLGSNSFVEDGDPDTLFDHSASMNHALAYGVEVNDSENSLVFADGAYAELASPVETPEAINTTEFTIALWITLSEEVPEFTQIIIGRGRACLASSFSWEILRYSDNGCVVFTYSNDGESENWLVSSICREGRYHFAVSVSETSVRMYVNSILEIEETAYVGEIPIPEDREIRIGKGWCPISNPSGSSFNGELSDIYLYSQCLSDVEVTAHYNSYL